MTIRKFDKAEWPPYFDSVSKFLQAKEAEIEVASLGWATRCGRIGCR